MKKLKGIMAKEFLTLSSSMYYYFGLALLWSLLGVWGKNFMSAYSIIYLAFIPFSSLSIDEASGWNRLEAALPYAKKLSVIAKYAVGLVLIAAGTVQLFVINLLFGLFGKGYDSVEIANMLFCGIVGGVFSMSLSMMLGYILSKGKVAVLGLVSAAGASLAFMPIAIGGGMDFRIWGVVTAAVAVFAYVSLLVSIKICERKEL